MKKLSIILLAIICVSLTANAEIRLPQLFQSGMVMQRGKPIPIWGWADKGEQVTITFQKKTYTTTADDEGRWRIDLPKQKAGGPFTLEVNSEGVNSEKLIINNILIGDVWLLSGQSNIDVTIERVYPQYVNEIDQFNNNQVRLFRVQNETAIHGVKDDIRPTSINWKPLTKQNVWLFSAVGSFLGKRMFEKNKVPQGIIVNSWGGTPIEAWISKDSLQKDYPMLVKRLAIYENDNYVRAQMQAGCEMGFYPAQAKQIALQTMQGAVSLLKETGWHPEEAIDKVTTPGGVTIKGLNELDHADFTSAVIRSLKAGLK